MRKLLSLGLLSVSLLYSGVIDEELFTEGKALYEQTCISCHGENGAGNEKMNLVVKPRDLTKSILDKDQLKKIISDGSHKWGSRSDFMPSFKYVFEDHQLNSVTHYIFHRFVTSDKEHQKFKLNSSWNDEDVSLKLGKKIYLRNCSLCHGVTGDGKSQYVNNSKEKENFIYPYNLQKIILTKEQVFLYSKYGGKFWGSSTTDMPSWNKKYDDKTLKSVAQYMEQNILKN